MSSPSEYDLILCNPPYVRAARSRHLLMPHCCYCLQVASHRVSTLPEEYRREPKLALYGQSRDGLAVAHRVLQWTPRALRAGGALLMEVACVCAMC